MNYLLNPSNSNGLAPCVHLLSKAHYFRLVLNHIKLCVVQQNRVVKLTDLRLLYTCELKQNVHDNVNYRGNKMLKHIQNDRIADKLFFTKVDRGKGDFVNLWLVCSARINVSDALSGAYTLQNKDKCQALRDSIFKAYQDCKELPWPPTADDKELNAEKFLPGDLVKFLSLLITGKKGKEKREQVKRWIFSICQDVCRAVSEWIWKLPKHILLFKTIRHLFRSKKLTTVLRRLGHSEGYDFGLEMETALSKVLDEASTHLTTHLLKGEDSIVFHCEWEN